MSWGVVLFASAIVSAFVAGWMRVGSPDRDLTEEQIINRGDQRLADLLQGDVR